MPLHLSEGSFVFDTAAMFATVLPLLVTVAAGIAGLTAADGPLVETDYGTVRGLSLTNYEGERQASEGATFLICLLFKY